MGAEASDTDCLRGLLPADVVDFLLFCGTEERCSEAESTEDIRTETRGEATGGLKTADGVRMALSSEGECDEADGEKTLAILRSISPGLSR